MPNNNGSADLHSQALLVSLSFSLCRQSRGDKKVSREIEDQKQAQHGVGKFSVFYFQQLIEETKLVKGKTVIVEHKNDALASLKSHFNAWRKEHDRLTMKWESGTGMLPALLVPRYLDVKATMEAKIPELKEELCSVYPDWATTGPDRMGHLYDPDDFPTLKEVMEDIGWSCGMIPLPTGEQFKRISLIAPDLANQMEQSTNEKVAKAFEEGRQQTWKDLLAPVNHIVEVLSKDKAKLYETLLGNLHSILELAPAFNLAGDTQMDLFVQRAKEDLGTVTIEDLRNSPELRQQTLSKANALIANFGEMGARKFA